MKSFFSWTNIFDKDLRVIVIAGACVVVSSACSLIPGIRIPMTVLCVVSLIVLLLWAFHGSRARDYERDLRLEKRRAEILMNNTGAELLVYNVKNDSIRAEGVLHKKYGIDFSLPLVDVLKKYAPEHPECDLDNVKKSLQTVIESGKVIEMNFPITYEQIVHWVRLTMIPYFSGGAVSNVFGLLVNETEEHASIKKTAELLKYIPGGYMRCRIDNGLTVEYLSESYAKMLGYTAEEYREIAGGSSFDFSVCGEDADKFASFVEKVREGEGINVCDYRMVCKDGHLITVSDTTETVVAPDGAMYGYCIIVDVTSKIQELEEAKEKIASGYRREHLLQAEQKRLSTAIMNTYSLVISVNLSRNSYSIMAAKPNMRKQQDHGAFDDLVSGCAACVPGAGPSREFLNTFGRENLLREYYAGKQTVSLRHRQIGEDGIAHWQDRTAMFVSPDDENGDITAVIVVKIVDEEQERLEQLKRLHENEKVYYDAIRANCYGYMEINLSTGYITSDIHVFGNGDQDAAIVNIPELGHPVKYDEFEKWWAENRLLSDKESFLKLSNCNYLLSRFNAGFPYEDFTSRCHVGGEDVDWRNVYIMTQNSRTGDVMCVCLLYDISKQLRQKEEIINLTEELRKSRIQNSVRQMQPHFLYNALASIREIILDDPQYASDLIYDFTTHLRACVRSLTHNELITFEEELKNIRAYVNIEKMRFGDKLDIEYDIECTDFQVVPLSIQPLVENAIRHGIYQRRSKSGVVRVSCHKTDSGHRITVSDNGVGFDYENVKAEVERGERDSTGLSSLTFRLEKILGASVDIVSTEGVGTVITVDIPEDIPENGSIEAPDGSTE